MKRNFIIKKRLYRRQNPGPNHVDSTSHVLCASVLQEIQAQDLTLSELYPVAFVQMYASLLRILQENKISPKAKSQRYRYLYFLLLLPMKIETKLRQVPPFHWKNALFSLEAPLKICAENFQIPKHRKQSETEDGSSRIEPTSQYFPRKPPRTAGYNRKTPHNIIYLT